MNRGDLPGAEIDNARRWAVPETSVRRERVNRRRPWHQRLVRKASRHFPPGGFMLHSPLAIFFVFNLLGCLLAVLFGYMAVAVVLAAAAIGCLACQARKNSDFLI